MKRALSLAGMLVLVVGCQAQGVKPNQVAEKTAPPADPTAPLMARFDQLGKSGERVEQRITLVQEQVIKLNQQMQGLQQRNLQLLQALQRMQLLQAQAQKKPAPAEADEANQQQLSAQENRAEVDDLVSRLERLAEAQEASGAGGFSQTSIDGAGFLLVSAYTPKGQWVIFKYDEATGLTWNAREGDWIEVGELGSLPVSVYQVVLRPAAGDVKGYVAARIDRETGRSWWLKGNTWEAFE